MIPTGYLLSFLCGQPLWRYSLAAELIFLISEWSIEGFDWATVSNRRIQKPMTRLAEISPILLKNNREEEWRCSDLWPCSQRAAGAPWQDWGITVGGQKTAPPTVSSVCYFCKDDGHLCPPSHLSTSPGLCSVMNGGRIGCVRFCPSVVIIKVPSALIFCLYECNECITDLLLSLFRVNT